MATSQNPLGGSIPAFTEHAISVSLPKWADNVGYEEGEVRVIGAMQTGYPRFFIHLNIQKVSINRNNQEMAMDCCIMEKDFPLINILHSSPPS
jgi:hypothetical protein